MKTNRREFLSYAVGSSAVIAMGAPPPRFLLEAAAAEAGSKDDTILVVVQLTGGNDGLNTVVPYADDDYRKNRPTLVVPESNVLRIDDDCGFHPSLRGFADLLEDDKLCIIQGVGYPNPNRSHFESMDIWHTCRRDKDLRTEGWLGRFLDATQNAGGSDVPALHFGDDTQPLALAARNVRVPTVRSLEQFRLQDDSGEVRSVIEQFVSKSRPSATPLLDFVQTSSAAAIAASQRVSQGTRDYAPKGGYPDTALARNLRLVAQLIDAALSTRIYYVALDGFDTHSNQADAHAALLRQLGGAVAAFIKDISAHGHDDRVLLMTFSEFGRRVKENASEGTDHGAAAPMFLAGGRVQPGLVGAHPSLTDLQDGDLKHHTDFRQVYATVLQHWLGWKSEPILGSHYEVVRCLRA